MSEVRLVAAKLRLGYVSRADICEVLKLCRANEIKRGGILCSFAVDARW
jgi:hypothetical protein